MADFHRTTYLVARKDYRCSACTHVILRGERYAYTAGKSDGEMVALREHTRCHELEWRFVDDDGNSRLGELMNAPDYAVNPSARDMDEWASIFGMPWPA